MFEFLAFCMIMYLINRVYDAAIKREKQERIDNQYFKDMFGNNRE